MHAPRRETYRAEVPGRRIPCARIHLARAMMTGQGRLTLLAAGSVLLGAARLRVRATLLGAIAALGAGAAFAVDAALTTVGMAAVIVAGASGQREHGGHGDSQQAGLDQ